MQRPQNSYRIWDKLELKWFEPIFEGYAGRILDLTVTMRGELTMRTINQTKHESTFPDRYEISRSLGVKYLTGEKQTMYEGDIVKYYNRRGIINQSVRGPYWILVTPGVEEPEIIIEWSKFFVRDMKYLGNIYEQPNFFKRREL
jgi:hypothetical protein